MLGYIARRLLLMVPTLFGIMVVNFFVVQAAPGGPVDRTLAQIRTGNVDATARITGQSNETSQSAGEGRGTVSRAARGLPPELVQQIERQYGFDKPLGARFWLMLKSYLSFDFGKSFYSDRRVVDLVIDKLPVSISLGLWSTLIIYAISVPLGIRKAVQDGSRFDLWSSVAIVFGYAIPSFLFAVLLIVLFAGGRLVSWFPLRGLVSDGWSALPWPARIADYLWHLVLPISALVIGGFAGLTMLTKNCFLEEINKLYVMTARSKGLTEARVLYGHVFRNAMLLVISGLPAAFIGILFTGSLLIEVIFTLDGLGLLGFEAAINRDYPIMFGTLYVFTLVGLLTNLLGDLLYVAVDPRIDFETRGG